jgi:hypothetical protein
MEHWRPLPLGRLSPPLRWPLRQPQCLGGKTAGRYVQCRHTYHPPMLTFGVGDRKLVIVVSEWEFATREGERLCNPLAASSNSPDCLSKDVDLSEKPICWSCLPLRNPCRTPPVAVSGKTAGRPAPSRGCRRCLSSQFGKPASQRASVKFSRSCGRRNGSHSPRWESRSAGSSWRSCCIAERDSSLRPARA